jgi:ribosomal-protein-alanine N-acetyltransferase
MDPDLFLVIVLKDGIIGYIIGNIEAWNECGNIGHIMNFAIKEEYRGRGLGTRLLIHLEGLFIKKEALTAYLEVRKSNIRGQSLYYNLGYEKVEIIPDYYQDEAGLIMFKRLDTR